MSIRCLVLEQARAVMDIPCRFEQCGAMLPGIDAWQSHLRACPHNRGRCMNSSKGCTVVLPEEELDKHQKECEHRTVRCPLKLLASRRACDDVMCVNACVQHMVEKHGSLFRPIELSKPLQFGFPVRSRPRARWAETWLLELRR
jgi:hypothetical protein